ncbi:prenyltransferase UbiA [Thermocladium modestius]|uniref:Prenyltransferase UbiA n=1 Tax=Thermocladium modestius TaxID=62609 RepID=A0A830GU11_9CREN|nr:UbiA family prenyltransferase [Thermocladium modestius]GGP20150.1 prenyltransferase UbiA [Thermocladium modestius]
MNPYIELARSEHGLIAGVAAISSYLFSGGREPLVAVMLFVSTFMAEVFLFVTNDLLNIAEDTVNRPQAPLITGRAGRRGASIMAVASMAASMISMIWLYAARLINVMPLLVLFAAIMLGFYYNWRGKRILIINNLIVSVVTPLTYIYGLSCVSAASDHAILVVLLLFFTSMIATLGRESIKGAIDVAGDSRVGVNTVATRKGKEAAVRLGMGATAAAVLISIPLMALSIRFAVFAASIAITDAIMIYCMLLLRRGDLEGYRRNSLVGMSITLLGFFINALMRIPL